MKANEISMVAAVVSANVFTFKRSKNCNFLFLCQTGSRAASFGGSLNPWRMTSFWSCFQFPAHDIFYCALCQTYMWSKSSRTGKCLVASRVVHRRLIMYETFFNDGLSLPDLHRRPPLPPPPWKTLHSTHVTHPPHSRSIWSGIARRPRSASDVGPRDADQSLGLCVSRLIRAPDGFCGPGLSGWERQKAAWNRWQMFASDGSERLWYASFAPRPLCSGPSKKPLLPGWLTPGSVSSTPALSRGSRHGHERHTSEASGCLRSLEAASH